MSGNLKRCRNSRLVQSVTRCNSQLYFPQISECSRWRMTSPISCMPGGHKLIPLQAPTPRSVAWRRRKPRPMLQLPRHLRPPSSPPLSPIIPEPVNHIHQRAADVRYLHLLFYNLSQSGSADRSSVVRDLEPSPLGCEAAGAPEDGEAGAPAERFWAAVERRLYRGTAGQGIRRLIGRMLDVKGNRIVWWIEWQRYTHPRYSMVTDDFLKRHGPYRQQLLDFLTRAASDALPYLAGPLHHQLLQLEPPRASPPAPPASAPPAPLLRTLTDTPPIDELDLALYHEDVEMDEWSENRPTDRPSPPPEADTCGPLEPLIPEPSALETWRHLETQGLLPGLYRQQPHHVLDLWFAAAGHIASR